MREDTCFDPANHRLCGFVLKRLMTLRPLSTLPDTPIAHSCPQIVCAVPRMNYSKVTEVSFAMASRDLFA